jgi:hypothetical protein
MFLIAATLRTSPFWTANLVAVLGTWLFFLCLLRRFSASIGRHAQTEQTGKSQSHY